MEQFEVAEYRRDKERWDRGKQWEWEGRGWKIKAAFMKKLDYMIRKKNLPLKIFTGHFTRLKPYILLISKQILHASETE